jgi:hypothetical protein
MNHQSKLKEIVTSNIDHHPTSNLVLQKNNRKMNHESKSIENVEDQNSKIEQLP